MRDEGGAWSFLAVGADLRRVRGLDRGARSRGETTVISDRRKRKVVRMKVTFRDNRESPNRNVPSPSALSSIERTQPAYDIFRSSEVD